MTMSMKIFSLVLLSAIAAPTLHAQSAASNSDTTITGGDSTLQTVEVESEFPGGAAGWARFLGTNLVYPRKAIKKNIQGEVVVQFIVDKTGAISDIHATSGPDLLRAAAEDVIRKSPNWKPAYQHGRKVKSYKKQPIIFRFDP